ncbi:hypothetical protein GCM10008090_00900 [Arenicella chitinivorans]|uniref:DUF3703 domain-containing protein n=1 Tax=Arenicella chitinivorans TaxID=1329800 RepID=A0A918RG33_9GAMM|nr:DUF3703 domain-containing protein [Arenicella chitinivorans]GGZ96489.1 hypothetical protein GCM10008090_00900 [Arenicella chitinivorans]
MQAKTQHAFEQEMALARQAYLAQQYDVSFARLERAHILGQRYFFPHLITHAWMFRVGMRTRRWREVIGQTLRLVAVVPGFLFGWVPIGNTGGANVSALRPMPIPEDLKAVVPSQNARPEYRARVLVWLLIGLVLLIALTRIV